LLAFARSIKRAFSFSASCCFFARSCSSFFCSSSIAFDLADHHQDFHTFTSGVFFVSSGVWKRFFVITGHIQKVSFIQLTACLLMFCNSFSCFSAAERGIILSIFISGTFIQNLAQMFCSSFPAQVANHLTALSTLDCASNTAIYASTVFKAAACRF
jgi:hypothetical protein